MRIARRKARVIKIGSVLIGGGYPVAIQSMTKSKTQDVESTLGQIRQLQKVGCEIVRLAIESEEDARAIRKIKQETNIPIVADIHFHWRLALEAIDNGADKVRLNPGNIYRKRQLREIISALKLAKRPLRVGVNSGSIRNTDSRRMSVSSKLVKDALNYIRTIEKFRFYDIVVSLKASNVLDTVQAYQKISRLCDYPLHLGVTATGSPGKGAIKSSIAIGSLLLQGIGDTIRVSLTDNPLNEVKVAKMILGSLGLRSFGPEIISCPTCGRCAVDLVGVVKKLEDKLSTMNSKMSTPLLKVAVMGCVVNGPGEAKEADLGVAFGKKEGLLFKKGEPIRKISPSESADVLLKEICKITKCQ